MAKGKVVWGTPEVYTRIPSTGTGFNSSLGKLGGDSQPGPGPGAILNSRSVPDSPTKSHHYERGIGPGSMHSTFQGNGTLGDLDAPTPTRDSPATGGPCPHPDLKTKAEGAASGGASIGDIPKGTLGR